MPSPHQPTHYSPLINVMLGAILKASRGVVRDFGEVENLQVSRKGTSSFVSNTDIRVEKILREELQKARPDYGFLSGESEEIKGKDRHHRWIVDPIDGTTNFIHGFPCFCISVALERTGTDGKKEIVAGITHAPIYRETFFAEKGKGTWMEATDYVVRGKLKIAARTTLADTMLGIGSVKRDGEEAARIAKASHSIRYMGSSALSLAYVAAGRMDGFFQTQTNIWDIAAGVLMVQEAGGAVVDYQGKNTILESETLIATNGALQKQILDLIQQ